jgi:glycosyltransferase involved in cell wall biosynthesis
MRFAERPGNPLRVLFMANVMPDAASGAAGTELQTIVALRKLGHQVDAVWRDELTHRIAHPNAHQLLELPYVYRSVMTRKLTQRDYDVVHVNQPHGYLAAEALHRMRPGAVFVHRSHGFESHVRDVVAVWRARYGEERRPIWRRVLSHGMEWALEGHNRRIARNADGHIVSASGCKAYMVERYGVSADKIMVIAQSAPAEFRMSPTKPMTERRLRRILYVGQFAFFKAPVVLVGAVQRILQARSDVEFSWVCNARHHAEAVALFSDRNVLDRVRLVDWMPQKSLMAEFDAHGVFLFPSFFEGFGKSFIEAMARGLVVIASNTGGMRDLISDGVNGFLIEPGKDEDLADSALHVLGSNVSRVSTISEKARETALRFSWSRTAKETGQFYSRLLDLNGRRRAALKRPK